MRVGDAQFARSAPPLPGCAPDRQIHYLSKDRRAGEPERSQQVLTGWRLGYQSASNGADRTSPIRALRPAASASLRFAPGRPLTGSFPGKNRHLSGGREDVAAYQDKHQ